MVSIAKADRKGSGANIKIISGKAGKGQQKLGSFCKA
jgi:hypothetical protein